MTDQNVSNVNGRSNWDYFSQYEMTCHCGCGRSEMDSDSMDRFVAIRRMGGIAMPVSSSYRCPDYNDKISSTGRTGPHTTGKAIDVVISGAESVKVLGMAIVCGVTGIGIRQKGPYEKRILHLDFLPQKEGQPRPHMWSY